MKKFVSLIVSLALLAFIYWNLSRKGQLDGLADIFAHCDRLWMAVSLGMVVPLTLFTMVVPIPFGALGLSEGISEQLFNLVGHPSGALAMMGFRILMYGSGLIGACVYLVNLKEIRSLSDEAQHLDDDVVEG